MREGLLSIESKSKNEMRFKGYAKTEIEEKKWWIWVIYEGKKRARKVAVLPVPGSARFLPACLELHNRGVAGDRTKCYS